MADQVVAKARRGRGRKDARINPPKGGELIIVPPQGKATRVFTVYLSDGTQHAFEGAGLGVLQSYGVLTIVEQSKLHAVFAPGQWLSVNYPPANVSK